MAFPVIFCAMTDEYHLMISLIRPIHSLKLTWPGQLVQGMDGPLPVLSQLDGRCGGSGS
jgi:hypothetical protein